MNELKKIQEKYQSKLGNEYKIINFRRENNRLYLTIEHQSEYCGFNVKELRSDKISSGRKCDICNHFKHNISSIKYEIDKINENEKFPYKLISDIYDNTTRIIELQHLCEFCDNHKFKTTFHEFKDGNNRCPRCSGQFTTTETIQFELDKLTNGEFSIISEYKKWNEPCKFKHNSEKCNFSEWLKLSYNMLNRLCCPVCSVGQQESRGEKELREFIESIVECYPKEYSVGILNGKDIDILTKNNIGFEYNGEYWHSEGNKVPIGYHDEKIKIAKEKGIELYHIWEKDWKNNKDEIKKFIESKIKIE